MKLSENSLFSGTLVAWLVALSFWLGVVYSNVEANVVANHETEARVLMYADKLFKRLNDIDRRLSRIEGKLGEN